MRLAMFLVAHSELKWLYPAQDVPEKYVMYGDSDLAGSGTRSSTTGAFEQIWTASHRIKLLDTTRRRSLKRRGKVVCNRTCGSRRVAVRSEAG